MALCRIFLHMKPGYLRICLLLWQIPRYCAFKTWKSKILNRRIRPKIVTFSKRIQGYLSFVHKITTPSWTCSKWCKNVNFKSSLFKNPIFSNITFSKWSIHEAKHFFKFLFAQRRTRSTTWQDFLFKTILSNKVHYC